MNNMTASWSPEQAQALEHAWGEYRVWAATSRQQKKEISKWRLGVLAATILGAVLGTVSSEISGLQATASTILGIVSGGLIAVATYLGREILKPDQERLWVRARSMAEALKGETFLFRTGAPPYDAPQPASKLLERVQELQEEVRDLQAATLSRDERQERLPEGPLSINQYIADRVDEQVEGFYLPKAQQYTEDMGFWRNVTLLVGGSAAVLGALGQWTGAWVAVLTTIGTSVAAYVFANRYQHLIVSYQATARQLALLKHQWLVLPASEQDQEKRHRFILNCEEAISIENSAWMTKMMEKPQS